MNAVAGMLLALNLFTFPLHSANSIAVTSPKAGDVWREGSTHTVSWTPYNGTFGKYIINLKNKLFPGCYQGGGPFIAVPKGKTSRSVDGLDFSANYVKALIDTCVWNADSWGHPEWASIAESDIRNNFFFQIVAIKKGIDGKSVIVKQGEDGGVFSILPPVSPLPGPYLELNSSLEFHPLTPADPHSGFSSDGTPNR